MKNSESGAICYLEDLPKDRTACDFPEVIDIDFSSGTKLIEVNYDIFVKFPSLEVIRFESSKFLFLNNKYYFVSVYPWQVTKNDKDILENINFALSASAKAHLNWLTKSILEGYEQIKLEIANVR